MNSLIVVYWCKFTSNHFCSKFTQILRQFESKNRSELVFFNWKATNTFRCQRVKKKENSNKKPTKVRSPQCDFSWLGKTRRCSKVICGGVTLQVLHPASSFCSTDLGLNKPVCTSVPAHRKGVVAEAFTVWLLNESRKRCKHLKQRGKKVYIPVFWLADSKTELSWF